MNTYDFDKTIFYPDSSVEFVLYCLKKYPKATWRTVPKITAAALRYALKISNTKELKEKIFSFLSNMPDVDKAVSEFWEEKQDQLQAWYLRQKREDDIIISASPEFLLEPICRKLGVKLIGTRMDKTSGRISGENCHDYEKVKRFYAAFPDAHIEAFYSDSLSDSPMAVEADRAFIVKKGNIYPWP